jgi:GTPase
MSESAVEELAGTVAIVGFPNVGKSTLINRLTQTRAAVVHETPGVTRDRKELLCDWNGVHFRLIDTGGVDLEGEGAFDRAIAEQARAAIGEADLVLFVVDARAGITPGDEELAGILRAARKPVLLLANKLDDPRRDAEAFEFHRLGLGDPVPLSALHGHGTGDLLDEIVSRLPGGAERPVGEDAIRVAILGRPNVGKSSLLNALVGQERVIVSDVPGTTRDAIDTTLEWGRSQIVLIDTAGIRRRGKVASGPAAERFSTLRALKAIGRADVAVLVIDAVDGLTAQDAHVAGYVVEEGRGLVVAVNKWDLVEDKTDRTFDQYVEWIRNQTPFLDFAPVVSISAKTRQRVGKVLELAIDIWGERRKRISTAELNRVLRAATERQQPPPVKGRRPKIFYGTQAAVAPPTFVFFANDASAVHFSYRRYLENRLRDEFGFHGTPLKLIFRDRESAKLPRRRKQPTTARRRAGAATRRR